MHYESGDYSSTYQRVYVHLGHTIDPKVIFLFATSGRDARRGPPVHVTRRCHKVNILEVGWGGHAWCVCVYVCVL